MVPAVCGALVGGIYLMDIMSIQSVRLPSVVYRCFSVSLCGGTHVGHIADPHFRDLEISE